MFQEKLREIGFSGSEASVYMELLKIGPQAVSTIAKRLGINRTTIYSILKSLEERGLVASYKNGSVKYFLSNDPNCLVGYLDRKCRTFDYYRKELLSIMPEIREIAGEYDFKKPVVSFFEGKEAVGQVLDEMFEAGVKLYVCLEYKEESMPLSLITLEKKNIRPFFDSSCGFDWNRLKSIISIYNNKVSILYLDKGNEYGVVIQSKEIAGMHKKVFDVAKNGFNMSSDES